MSILTDSNKEDNTMVLNTERLGDEIRIGLARQSNPDKIVPGYYLFGIENGVLTRMGRVKKDCGLKLDPDGRVLIEGEDDDDDLVDEVYEIFDDGKGYAYWQGYADAHKDLGYTHYKGNVYLKLKKMCCGSVALIACDKHGWEYKDGWLVKLEHDSGKLAFFNGVNTELGLTLDHEDSIMITPKTEDQ